MAAEERQPISADAIRRAYDTVAADYAAYLPDTRAEALLDLAMIREFADTCLNEPQPQVLDAGCGAGRMTRHLIELDCAVEGMDLSPEMVNVARGASPDLQFTIGSLTRLPYADAQFAGVLLWYSIIHTPAQQLQPIFAEAARVLRPGGHVLVGFQAGEGVRDLADTYRRFGHEIELERYRHTMDQVIDVLERTGFSVRAQQLRRPADSERDDQAAVLARLG